MFTGHLTNLEEPVEGRGHVECAPLQRRAKVVVVGEDDDLALVPRLEAVPEV